MTMTRISANEYGKELIDIIKSKDARKTIAKVQQFRNIMKDTTVGADYVNWITEPANLTEVHKALANDLNVPPKLLSIRRISPARTLKAAMLLQAIEMSVKKVHKL